MKYVKKIKLLGLCMETTAELVLYCNKFPKRFLNFIVFKHMWLLAWNSIKWTADAVFNLRLVKERL